MIIGKDKSNRYLMSSLTRITDLENFDFDVEKLDREKWGHGDYVAARVTNKPNPLYQIEIPTGRMAELMEDDLIIGVFGKRAATLEGVGDWEAIGDNGQMHALTSAGLLGKATSTSLLLPRFMSLEYEGHVLREGRKQTMRDFIEPVTATEFDSPVILMVGTSMSAGKTTAGRVIIRELQKAGLRVVGAKFTGAGRYRDTLSYGDAGAAAILDFVDAGLPSTIVPEPRFEEAMRYMLSRIAAIEPDVVVAEAGASPMEPYNGAIAIEALSKHVVFVVLCALDPYSVVGVEAGFGLRPDVITGPATNTTAGIELAEKLTQLPALNLMDKESLPRLREMLRAALPGQLGVTPTGG
ncbi:MAG: NAD-dependent epimerase/dehydratase family protein [Gammaproteobacteria bacterium]|nr:NAD-dependent epimerase/dehydratase family protein [Gammaproteobacteria bacterium]